MNEISNFRKINPASKFLSTSFTKLRWNQDILQRKKFPSSLFENFAARYR